MTLSKANPSPDRSNQDEQHLAELSRQLVEAASQAGAVHADALAVADTGNSISVRNGAVESVEREDSQGIGLRAFVETAGGLAFASASSSDISAAGLKALAGQVIAMARISEPDPDAVPPVGADHPDTAAIADWRQRHPEREAGWTLDDARQNALACEDIARGYSPKITNSEGADAAFGSTRVAYAASDGFAASYAKSSASLSVSVIAGAGEAMQRDYAWHRALHVSDLRSAEDIANEAASRAVNRLGPGTMASGKASVVFEPRVATSLLGHLIGAINGR
ncbi:MAG: DNA gyrase modulator, partial [Mariprofundaceae bacterium]